MLRLGAGPGGFFVSDVIMLFQYSTPEKPQSKGCFHLIHSFNKHLLIHWGNINAQNRYTLVPSGSPHSSRKERKQKINKPKT